MDTSIENIIKLAAANIFNNITLIDIINDKVTLFACDETLNAKESNTYEQYYEKLKNVIHPDYLNDYFNAISLNNLKTKSEEVTWVKYSKLANTLSYDTFIDAIKLLSDEKILVLSFKYTEDSDRKEVKDDLKYAVADFIINIESVLANIKSNDYEINNVVKYINELINDMLSKNNSVLKEYENKVTLEVNKTYRSLLIVDDDNLTRNIFKKVFEQDFNIIEAKNGAEAVEIIENNILNANNSEPKNIVGMFLDLKMPVMDGFGVLDYLKEKRLIDHLPVVIISADDAKETKERVYSYSIADMIEKPFNFELIKKRVTTMINMYAKSNILNNLVQMQDKELKNVLSSYEKAYLIDSASVFAIFKQVANALLKMYQEDMQITLDIDTIISASKYYDIALNSVPRSYLNRLNELSNEERDLITNYPNTGMHMVKYLTENASESYVRYASEITKLHNERYDGLGFPNRFQKEEIPMYIYLINLALEYANLKVMQKDILEIENIIISKSGSKYHPKAVEIFQKVKEEIK